LEKQQVKKLSDIRSHTVDISKKINGTSAIKTKNIENKKQNDSIIL